MGPQQSTPLPILNEPKSLRKVAAESAFLYEGERNELYRTMQQFMKFHLGLISHLCDAGADLAVAEATLR